MPSRSTSAGAWPDPTNVAPLPPKVNSVAFLASLTERGSQVSTFDYAYYARKLLGLRVIVLLHDDVQETADANASRSLVLSRWSENFELARMRSPEETGSWRREQGCFDFLHPDAWQAQRACLAGQPGRSIHEGRHTRARSCHILRCRSLGHHDGTRRRRRARRRRAGRSIHCAPR